MLAAVFAAVVLPLFISAQVPDDLHVGDRVRVRVADTRDYTSVFIGNVASLARDSMTLEIPGNKATMVLPRLAIAEVAISSGRRSRLSLVPSLLIPLALPISIAATASSFRGSHANGLRNQTYITAGALLSLPLARLFTATPRERWRPVYTWLDGK